jgi:hypothetical protein
MKLTVDDFDEKYSQDKSIRSKNFPDQYGQLETYGNDLKVLKRIFKKTPKRIWTFVDSDNGVEIIAGFHFVNRIYYIVTNENWADENESYVVFNE